MSNDNPDFRSMGEQPTAVYAALEDSSPDIAAEQRSVELAAGDVVGGRFEILCQLGYGGMGAVYRVKDLKMDEERALKVMLPSLLRSARAQSRFLEEIKVSQKLSYDKIVHVYDWLMTTIAAFNSSRWSLSTELHLVDG